MQKVGADPELDLKHWHYLRLHITIIIYYAVTFWGEVKAVASRNAIFARF